jgi:hypothetical protein
MNLFNEANESCCSIWRCKEIQSRLISDAIGLTTIVMQMNLVGFGEVIESSFSDANRFRYSIW